MLQDWEPVVEKLSGLALDVVLRALLRTHAAGGAAAHVLKPAYEVCGDFASLWEAASSSKPHGGDER